MSSPFSPIVNAVKTAVQTAAPTLTVVARRTDAVLARDTLPLCVVSFGGERAPEWAVCGEGSASDQGDIGKRYGVVIAIYRENLASLASSSTNPDLIDDIKESLNKGGLTGVSAVWDVELEAHDEWERQPFRDAHEVSRFVLWFGTSELRNG